MTAPHRTNWPLVALLYGVGLLAAGQFAKIALTLEPLTREYPGRDGLIPFAVSALSVTGILFGTVAGALVARFGVRRALLTGLTLGALLSLAQATLPPFPVFMALRLLEGVAHLSLVVAAPTLMVSVSRKADTSVVMGLWGTFFGVGFSLVALVLPWLLAVGGLRAVYLAHAAGLGGLAIVLLPILPRAGVTAPTTGGWLARHIEIYSSLRTATPALMFIWHALMFLALLTFLPRFLGEGIAPVLPLVALIGTLGAGVLCRWITPLRLAAAGFAVTALAFALLPLLPDAAALWLALPLFVVIGLAPGAAFAAIPWLNDSAPDRARSNGALAQFGNIGTAASTPLFALTLGAGLAGPSYLAAALSVAGAAVLWIIHRKLAHSLVNSG